MGDLPIFQSGKPLSATQLQQVVDYIKTLGPISAGPGLIMRQSPGGIGLMLALAEAGREYLVPAVITDVFGSVGDRIETVKYTAGAIGAIDTQTVGVAGTGITPRYGRVFANGPAVQPAQVGDFCIIVRAPQDDGSYKADLCILTEQILSRQCGSSPGALTGTAADLKKRPDKLPLLENRPPDAFITSGRGGGAVRSAIPPGDGGFETLGGFGG